MEDKRIVLTLDAGGTNFVFSAIREGVKVAGDVRLPAEASCLEASLTNMVEGFRRVMDTLREEPVAISFAFPGPADYAAGIIGDLPNFPSFRGGVALGPFLEDRFGLPVFINNDGNLFAYGEALTGALPDVNRRLKEAGSIRQYRNLLGITLGTGFGAGVVLNGQLLTGDNGCGGDVWCLRNKKYPQYIIEDSVSIRAVKRVYAERSGDASCQTLEPLDICRIAEGTRAGNREAALASFAELGELAGDAIATAATLVDGLVVIGGGLSGASRFIFPSMLREMNARTGMMDGATFPRLQMRAYDLDDEAQFAAFARGEAVRIPVPGSERTVDYDPQKRIGILRSRQGTSYSVAIGAYYYALHHL